MSILDELKAKFRQARRSEMELLMSVFQAVEQGKRVTFAYPDVWYIVERQGRRLMVDRIAQRPLFYPTIPRKFRYGR